MADKNQALAKALRTSSNEPQYIRGNLLPFKKDIKTKEVSFGMPTVAQGLIDALTAPYRAMKGEIDVDSPQGVQEALNFGLNMMGGGFGSTAVKPVQSGSLGMFIGRTSPSWNAAKAKQAIELEKAGLAPQKIWSQTGTIRGADGKLRQEIDDSSAGFKRKETQYSIDNYPIDRKHEANFNDAYQHNELINAYPDISNIKLNFQNLGKNVEGNYADNVISINTPKTKYGADAENANSFMLHELQHAIQQQEGFARGGNPGMMSTLMQQNNPNEYMKLVKSGAFDDPSVNFNLYKKLAGEAEARLTQARKDLTPEQRLQFYPYSENNNAYGLDVPFKDLIIRK